MTTDEFNSCLEHMKDLTVRVLAEKAKEYATDDRLHNFKAAGSLQRETPVKALGGMMAKHTISVYDLIHDYDEGNRPPIELWKEKITDSINYLFLLWALVCETG